MTDDPFMKMFQQKFPDLYAAGRKADDELGEVSFRLAQVAREIIESKNGFKPLDMAAKLNADLGACASSADSWIKSNYNLPETLVAGMGESCIGGEQAKQQLAITSWAAALSEPQVAAALRQAMEAIVRAAACVLLQSFFMMAGPERRKDVEAVTEELKNAVAQARTIVMGL